ncbi:helix-turn-helix domain-containing protein [Paenibacillus sp. 2RAB27]|uniref:helix-turn-helix domain-containing protein n=1 Tax=Paenibacillus sp. 2RAB27 TaxID=3232991 RepID=UPI003F9A9118
MKEGVAAARARGRVGGRPRTDQKKLDSALKLYDAQTHSISEICSLTSVSSSVLYRAIRARKKDQQ